MATPSLISGAPAAGRPVFPPAIAGGNEIQALLARVAAGEGEAFAALYELLSPRLYALCLRTTRRRDLAEEALQESFLRIWKSARLFDPAKGSALGWLCSITRNRARTVIARSARYDRMAGGDDILAVLPGDEADGFSRTLRSQAASKIRQCLESLGEHERTAILMGFFDGLTHAQIAQKLDIPLGTAKSRVRRGLSRLKPCLSGSQDLALHELLAGEHTLGVLPVRLDDAYARIRERDDKYCVAADWWQEQLAPMIYWLQPVRPPRSVWTKIERGMEAGGGYSRPSWEWWLLPISILGVFLIEFLR